MKPPQVSKEETMYCVECDTETFTTPDGDYKCPSCGDILTQEEIEEDFEDDGQPTEYEEWQDLYGGDDCDHGQYDDCM